MNLLNFENLIKYNKRKIENLNGEMGVIRHEVITHKIKHLHCIIA